MYGPHDMRQVDFRGLTVVNGHPGFGASQPQPLRIPQPRLEFSMLVGHISDSRNDLQKNALE